MSQKDPEQVLKIYLTNCYKQQDFTECVFASNATLEWFGKKFHGSREIFQYFRFNLWHQYEHIFEKAKACEPFELTPSHHQTQVEPPENYVQQNPTISSAANSGESTPPQTSKKLELPAVTQGRKFVPLSDDETDLCKEVQCTPPRRSIQPIDTLLGCQPLPDSDSDQIDSIDHSTKKKIRRKRANTSDDTESVMKRQRSSKNTTSHGVGIASTSTGPQSSPTIEQNDPTELAQSQYSKLQYIESIGMIRTVCTPKHRGISLNFSGNSASGTISTSSPRHGHRDRNTKLKISYRIRLCDGELQFVLIIYEHMVKRPQTRCNLMEKFNASASVNETKNPNKPKPGKKVLKTISSLKRLRF